LNRGAFLVGTSFLHTKYINRDFGVGWTMQESDKRYKAVLRTPQGIRTMGFFEDVDKAHRWIMGRWDDCAAEQKGARVYDQAQNNKQVFEMDPHFLFVGQPPE
jgi:hypothetical protein